MRHSVRAILLLLMWGLVVCAQKPQPSRFCFVSANDLADQSAPQFQRYLVKAASAFYRHPLDLQSNPTAKMYRTVIREELKKGPNFAGLYRVAVWGCGSSCAQFVVVNLKTGKAISPKGVNSVSSVHFGADDFLPGADSEGGLRFRKDSRLLVIVGAINESDSNEGAFYYVLSGDKLELVHKTIAARNTCTPDNE